MMFYFFFHLGLTGRLCEPMNCVFPPCAPRRFNGEFSSHRSIFFFPPEGNELTSRRSGAFHESLQPFLKGRTTVATMLSNPPPSVVDRSFEIATIFCYLFLKPPLPFVVLGVRIGSTPSSFATACLLLILKSTFLLPARFLCLMFNTPVGPFNSLPSAERPADFGWPSALTTRASPNPTPF